MSETSHTPGPWKIWDNDPDRWTIRGRGPIVSGVIASVQIDWFHDDQREEQKANARLIAAAPDLLAALKELVRFESGEWSVSLRPEAMDAAVDAIAKAEGRTE